jgi:hypothetical protein
VRRAWGGFPRGIAIVPAKGPLRNRATGPHPDREALARYGREGGPLPEPAPERWGAARVSAGAAGRVAHIAPWFTE